MSIMANIIKKIEEQKADKDDTSGVTSKLQYEAIAAILGGVKSDAWVTYMKNFVDADSPDHLAQLTPDNSVQLARLTARDSAGNDPHMRQSIAYLVANATCGSPTLTKLADQLSDGLLDQGL